MITCSHRELVLKHTLVFTLPKHGWRLSRELIYTLLQMMFQTQGQQVSLADVPHVGVINVW